MALVAICLHSAIKCGRYLRLIGGQTNQNVSPNSHEGPSCGTVSRIPDLSKPQSFTYKI